MKLQILIFMNTIKNCIKKLILFFLFAFASNVIFAQDLIITKDAKKIEAKIMEINVNDIKYKLYDNLDGPTYTMLKQDISSVIYTNGTIELFEDTQQKTQNLPKTETPSVRTDFLQLTDAQQEEHLRTFDLDLYGKFQKGQKLSSNGKGLIWGGALWILLGGIDMLAATAEWQYYTGVVFFVGGWVMLPVGIPLAVVGGSTKKSVQNEYQEKYLSKTSPSGQFQLQLSGNGLGLAYVF